MEVLRWFNFSISIFFVVCYIYQFVYIPISIIWGNKQKKGYIPPEEAPIHEYAVMVCARNEDAVIADLVKSVYAQDYPREKLQVFVMADNCTDETALRAREAGAIVYERSDTEHIGKSFALDALIHHIFNDFPGRFDGFFVFDADNLLGPGFIRNMNAKFSEGHEIITSYRNSKNYGSNWLSAGISLWFLRESRYLNYPRYITNACCTVTGTGFLVRKSVLEEFDGWPFHTMTEDTEISAEFIVQDRKIVYCKDAEFFDEQPLGFWQSLRQRTRWGKGYLQVIGKYGGRLIKGMFTGSWACFDFFMNYAPAYLVSLASILANLALTVLGLIRGGSILAALGSVGELILNGYIVTFIVGLITTITEWNRIHTSTFKKIFYLFTFPLYLLTFIPISVAAIFVRPSWKPIKHTLSVKELQRKGEGIPVEIPEEETTES